MMEKYEDEVNDLNNDKEFSNWISAEEDARKLLNTQLKYAENQGESKKTLEIAQRMLKEGLDKESIIKYTGLSKEELEKLSS